MTIGSGQLITATDVSTLRTRVQSIFAYFNITSAANAVAAPTIGDLIDDELANRIVSDSIALDELLPVEVFYAVNTAAKVNAGNNYSVGDQLTVSGGTGTAALLTVTSIIDPDLNDLGPIDSFIITGNGLYTTKPTNSVSVTGGTGSSATFNLTYASPPPAALNGGDLIKALSPWVFSKAIIDANYAITVDGNASTNDITAAAITSIVTATGQGAKTVTTANFTGTVSASSVFTFASEAAMNAFFRSGGVIITNPTVTGTPATPQDTAWKNLGAAFIDVSTKINHAKWRTLTGTDTILHTQLDETTSYTMNYIRVWAAKTATTITIKVDFVDAHTNAWSDNVTVDVGYNFSITRCNHATFNQVLPTIA